MSGENTATDVLDMVEELDLDSLLDTQLDDIEDLPSFKPFAPGLHNVMASFELTDVNGKSAVELQFTYVSTIELADPEDEPPKEGDTCNTMFILSNKYGLGNFKKCASPFKEALGLSTLRDVIENAKSVECVLLNGKHRSDKEDPDKKYLNVKEIVIS